MKEIFIIPSSYSKLMAGKIGALLILSVFYSFYSFVLTTGLSILFYPIGLTGIAIIKALLQICGMGLCICISIMPFICWSGSAKNRFWVGTVLVFVYGILGIPLAGHGFQDYYPISAGLSIIQYSRGHWKCNIKYPSGNCWYYVAGNIGLIYRYSIHTEQEKTKLKSFIPAGRRQKKKSRRAAVLFPCLITLRRL